MKGRLSWRNARASAVESAPPEKATRIGALNGSTPSVSSWLRTASANVRSKDALADDDTGAPWRGNTATAEDSAWRRKAMSSKHGVTVRDGQVKKSKRAAKEVLRRQTKKQQLFACHRKRVELENIFAVERCPSWPKEHDWKSCVPKRYREFESPPLRQYLILPGSLIQSGKPIPAKGQAKKTVRARQEKSKDISPFEGVQRGL